MEKCLISWKCKTAYNFASVNRLDNSACYVQWKRDTGETFRVLLSGQSREVDITCGMQKLAKLKQFARRMTFRSLCPRKKNARKLPKGVFFVHVHTRRIVPNFDGRQIIKIVACLFLELRAFFYSKVWVCGLSMEFFRKKQGRRKSDSLQKILIACEAFQSLLFLWLVFHAHR